MVKTGIRYWFFPVLIRILHSLGIICFLKEMIYAWSYYFIDSPLMIYRFIDIFYRYGIVKHKWLRTMYTLFVCEFITSDINVVINWNDVDVHGTYNFMIFKINNNKVWTACIWLYMFIFISYRFRSLTLKWVWTCWFY